MQQFEQRKAQLQQRVLLIEQLRKGQTGPVHMLDQISRALPPMLWLTELKQGANDVTIDGRCTTLTGISDFVANLEATGYFKRSIEIVSTTAEPAHGAARRAGQVQSEGDFPESGRREGAGGRAARRRAGADGANWRVKPRGRPPIRLSSETDGTQSHETAVVCADWRVRRPRGRRLRRVFLLLRDAGARPT